MSSKYEELSQKTQLQIATKPSLETRPTNCPKCSSKNVVKNGNYPTSSGKKQRFICKDCSANIYLLKNR